MPIDWKADIPFKAFIASRERRHSAAHANGTPIKRPSAENQPAIAKSPTVEDDEKGLHDAEGTLEMQKMLLGKLARRENSVKGLVLTNSRSNTRMDWEVSQHSLAPETDLEEWKGEMAQALYKIWGPQSKSHLGISMS